jgi:hypothetical protein
MPSTTLAMRFSAQTQISITLEVGQFTSIALPLRLSDLHVATADNLTLSISRATADYTLMGEIALGSSPTYLRFRVQTGNSDVFYFTAGSLPEVTVAANSDNLFEYVDGMKLVT